MYVFLLSVAAFIALVLLAAYRYREVVLPYMPRAIRSRLEVYAPLPSFDDAAAAGFSTATFNLADNEGDERTGLDQAGLDQIRRIMSRVRVRILCALLTRQYNISFDEARLRRQRAPDTAAIVS